MTRLIILLITVIALTACKNQIYFYETEKMSLALEGRPDPSSPVSGNFGIKQRVVAIVPAKQEGEGLGTEQYDGPKDDAVSMISYFDFKKAQAKTGFLNDPITIETALITGAAATALSKEEAQEAYAAISGSAMILQTSYLAALSHMEASLREMKTAEAVAHADALAALEARLPRTYEFTMYEWGRCTKDGVERRSLKTIPGHVQGKPTEGTGFGAVTNYISNLVKSIEVIETGVKEASLLIDCDPAQPPQVHQMSLDLGRMKARRDAIAASIQSDPSYRAAINYYFNTLRGK